MGEWSASHNCEWWVLLSSKVLGGVPDMLVLQGVQLQPHPTKMARVSRVLVVLKPATRPRWMEEAKLCPDT